MSHVFISYSKKDHEYARALADHLLAQGFDVWIDDRIDYGENWEREVFGAIDTCAAFLVIMTPASSESRWVQREYHHAEKREKPPFPFLLEGDVFPFYGPTQYVDVRDKELPPNGFFERLAKSAPRKSAPGKDVTATDAAPKIVAVTEILPLPFEWCVIPPGKVAIQFREDAEDIEFDVPVFAIAKYPITNSQYQVFLDAQDGYSDQQWWKFSESAIAWRKKRPQAEDVTFSDSDLPRTEMSWYDAIAFCQWLSARTGLSISLPTEQQWQRAAQGDDKRIYPWGNQFDKERCNSRGNLLSQPTPVTQYTNGVSPYGVMDMSGNVGEWCLSELGTNSNSLKGSGLALRMMRGGSFVADSDAVRLISRQWYAPTQKSDFFGFRCVRSY